MKVSSVLFHVIWLSSVYFGLLALNHYVIQSRFVLFGIIQELVTIPLMLIQLPLFVSSFVYCVKDSFNIKSYSFWSFVISLVNCVLIGWTFLRP